MATNKTLPMSAQPPSSSYYLLRNTVLLTDISTLPGITPHTPKYLGPPVNSCTTAGNAGGVQILTSVGATCCEKGNCIHKIPQPTPRPVKHPPHRPVHPRRCTGQERSAFACNPQADITGVTAAPATPWLEYALIGGAGYIGYKAYKKHKATGKWF